jgi:hypothetical protein
MDVVIREAFFIYAEVWHAGLYFFSTSVIFSPQTDILKETHSIFANTMNG